MAETLRPAANWGYNVPADMIGRSRADHRFSQCGGESATASATSSEQPFMQKAKLCDHASTSAGDGDNVTSPPFWRGVAHDRGSFERERRCTNYPSFPWLSSECL